LRLDLCAALGSVVERVQLGSRDRLGLTDGLGRGLALAEHVLLKRGANTDLVRVHHLGVREEAVVPPVGGTRGAPLPAGAKAAHPPVLGRAAAPAQGRDAVRAALGAVVLRRVGVEALAHGEEDGLDGEAGRGREAVVLPQDVEGTDVGHVRRVRVVCAGEGGDVEGREDPAAGPAVLGGGELDVRGD
jgi:hypothetical protein